MAETQRKFWQGLWKNRVAEDFSTYLPGYVEKSDPVVELFRRRGIRTVCDADCWLSHLTGRRRWTALIA